VWYDDTALCCRDNVAGRRRIVLECDPPPAKEVIMPEDVRELHIRHVNLIGGPGQDEHHEENIQFVKSQIIPMREYFRQQEDIVISRGELERLRKIEDELICLKTVLRDVAVNTALIQGSILAELLELVP